jgi:GPH family glycoside/pentoside/hexuronide:cation symporter
MIPWAMIPDVVEHDELRTGHRREGLFYGGTTFSYKLATALAVLTSSIILELVGYVPNLAQQSPIVLVGMRLMIGPLPAFIILVGAWIALSYSLNREEHQEILKTLEKRRRLNIRAADVES